MVDLEVRTLVLEAGRDDQKHLDAAKRFYDMWKKQGRVPSTDAAHYEFWRHVAHYADVEGNKALFEEVVEQYRRYLGQSKNYSRMLPMLERRLEEWKD